MHTDIAALYPLLHVRSPNAHTSGLEIAILGSQDDKVEVIVGPGCGAVKVLNLLHIMDHNLT
ncbi:hypothetical protein DPMN_001366 [Dreissena polymorpha]|uniref:Uncharacterized protein n=1 Tax=Dreissena polymorpha TaxID=45954 RepID=A0A9D4MJX2_DREPO|nr:hypothetical protein DPMN_001366 [Dreissena polymorpha]